MRESGVEEVVDLTHWRFFAITPLQRSRTSNLSQTRRFRRADPRDREPLCYFSGCPYSGGRNPRISGAFDARSEITQGFFVSKDKE
jgi:hypothetical protein